MIKVITINWNIYFNEKYPEKSIQELISTRYSLSHFERSMLYRGITTIEKPEIEIITDPSPDHLIRKAKTGIIATSDSTIIDKSALPVFDLPRTVLEFHFVPKFLRLDNF